MAAQKQTNGSDPGEARDHDAELGIRWWNGLTPERRRYWLEVAGSARPVDAYEAFLACRQVERAEESQP